MLTCTCGCSHPNTNTLVQREEDRGQPPDTHQHRISVGAKVFWIGWNGVCFDNSILDWMVVGQVTEMRTPRDETKEEVRLRCLEAAGRALGVRRRKVCIRVKWSDSTTQSWHNLKDLLALDLAHSFARVGWRQVVWVGASLAKTPVLHFATPSEDISPKSKAKADKVGTLAFSPPAPAPSPLTYTHSNPLVTHSLTRVV